MTEELFRDDAALITCYATVVALESLDGHTGVVLDRTVFYPLGGGQAGDAGSLHDDSGHEWAVADTRKSKAHAGGVLHLLAPGSTAPAPGTRVRASIDVQRRRAHMRFHTATHLLCALVPYPVDGCSITAGYARLDFHTAEPIDKEALNQGLARLVSEAHAVRHRWIDEAELDANPGLVRSMRVQPPRSASGLGRVRVLEIDGVDLQPCGGTHVGNTLDVGAVVVTKIEKKSALTRRVVLGFAS
jgi:misacylated tRNA(Ala) deacylase